MITQRLHALVSFLASSTLNDKVLPMMCHVKAKVVLASEDFATIIANEFFLYVARFHVNPKLVSAPEDLIANRALVLVNLHTMNDIVLFKLVRMKENNFFSFAVDIAASVNSVLNVVVVVIAS